MLNSERKFYCQCHLIVIGLVIILCMHNYMSLIEKAATSLLYILYRNNCIIHYITEYTSDQFVQILSKFTYVPPARMLSGSFKACVCKICSIISG